MHNEAGPEAIPMGGASQPLVSVALPVYNGENYIRQALDSILAQTYHPLELILSDNGSTDATPSICREYAARDSRIRYYGEEKNRGATWNFNRVIDMARGEFFRWASHDDVCAPELLERCLAVMLARPEVVLCFPRTRIIGPAGEFQFDYPVCLRTDSGSAGERFREIISKDHACFQIFGMMRTEVLRRTPRMGYGVGTDRNLLAELSLMGPFHEIPEYLFFRRDHPNTSTRQFPNAKDRVAWFTASHRSRRNPTVNRAVGYLQSVMRVPLPLGERLLCLGYLAQWTGQRLRHLLSRAGHVPEPVLPATSVKAVSAEVPPVLALTGNPVSTHGSMSAGRS